MPAIVAPHATAVLASMSPPSSHARGRPRAISSAARRLMPSVSGVAWRLVYDSTAWVKASMPLAAVTLLGHATVSAGSTMAALASHAQLRMLFLTLVSSLISTELGVASAPAPAVVGMAIQGSVLSGSDTRPSKCAAVGLGEKNKPATALAAS